MLFDDPNKDSKLLKMEILEPCCGAASHSCKRGYDLCNVVYATRVGKLEE